MTNLIVVFAGHSLLTEAIQINTVVAFIPVGSVLKVSEIFRRGQALFCQNVVVDDEFDCRLCWTWAGAFFFVDFPFLRVLNGPSFALALF